MALLESKPNKAVERTSIWTGFKDMYLILSSAARGTEERHGVGKMEEHLAGGWMACEKFFLPLLTVSLLLMYLDHPLCRRPQHSLTISPHMRAMGKGRGIMTCILIKILILDSYAALTCRWIVNQSYMHRCKLQWPVVYVWYHRCTSTM
jgi:hypothetical protein